MHLGALRVEVAARPRVVDERLRRRLQRQRALDAGPLVHRVARAAALRHLVRHLDHDLRRLPGRHEVGDVVLVRAAVVLVPGDLLVVHPEPGLRRHVADLEPDALPRPRGGNLDRPTHPADAVKDMAKRLRAAIPRAVPRFRRARFADALRLEKTGQADLPRLPPVLPFLEAVPERIAGRSPLRGRELPFAREVERRRRIFTEDGIHHRDPLGTHPPQLIPRNALRDVLGIAQCRHGGIPRDLRIAGRRNGKPHNARMGLGLAGRFPEHVEELDPCRRGKVDQRARTARCVDEVDGAVRGSGAGADVIRVDGHDALVRALALDPRVAVLRVVRRELPPLKRVEVLLGKREPMADHVVVRRRNRLEDHRILDRREKHVQDRKRRALRRLVTAPDEHVRVHRDAAGREAEVADALAVGGRVGGTVGAPHHVAVLEDRRSHVMLAELHQHVGLDFLQAREDVLHQPVHRIGKRAVVASRIVVLQGRVVLRQHEVVDEVQLDAVEVPFADDALVGGDQVLAHLREPGVEDAGVAAPQHHALELRIILRLVAHERDRQPEHVLEARLVHGGDMRLHVREPVRDRHPVAGGAVERAAVDLLPSVVEDHGLHAERSGKARLFLQLVRMHVLKVGVPRGIERGERGLRRVRGDESVFPGDPFGALADGVGEFAAAPVEHHGHLVFAERRDGRGEELAAADHLARPVVRVEPELEGVERLGARERHRRAFLRVEADGNRRLPRQLGLELRRPAPPELRPHMVAVAREVARPHVLHARARHPEEHAELRRLRGGGRRNPHRNHVAPVVLGRLDVELPVSRVVARHLGRAGVCRVDGGDHAALVVHVRRERARDAEDRDECHDPHCHKSYSCCFVDG